MGECTYSFGVGERGGEDDPKRWRGSRILPKLPEGNLSLSADFWLARGIDDVTVQKSADVSEVECLYTILLLSWVAQFLPISIGRF